jgi:hypothetical protein
MVKYLSFHNSSSFALRYFLIKFSPKINSYKSELVSILVLNFLFFEKISIEFQLQFQINVLLI